MCNLMNLSQVRKGGVNARLSPSPLTRPAPAPAVLRVLDLKRLLEAVKSGVSLDGLAEATRPAARQPHFATYLTELVLALFDVTQFRGL